MEVIRVRDEEGMREALSTGTYDLTISEFKLPRINAKKALVLHREFMGNKPFLLVTGAITPEQAVEIVREGAQDLIMKDRLARLIPAIEREVGKAGIEREHADAKSRLAEAEDKFRRIFNNTTDGIFLFDPESMCFLDCNAAGLRMLGYDKSEFLALNIADLLPAEELPSVNEQISKSARGEKSLRSDVRFKRKDGTLMHVYLCQTHLEINGQRQLLIIFRDITEHKKAGEALARSEQKYRTVIRMANDAIFLADAETGCIIEANDAAEKLIGRSRDEIIGMHQMNLHPLEERQKYMDLFNANTRNIHSMTFDRLVSRKDGSTIPVSISASVFELENRKVIQGIFRDDTMQKEAERAVRDQEERFRYLFENMKSAVAVYKPIDGGEDFEFIDVNESLIDIERITREEVIGKRVTEVFPSAEAFGLLDVFRRVNRTGKPEDFPAKEYKDDRITGWRDYSVFRLNSGEVIAIYNDVTAEKIAELKLKASEIRFKSVFEAANVGKSLTELGGRMYVNRAFADMLGYSVEEMNNTTWQTITPEEEIAPTEAKLRELTAGKVNSLRFNKRYIRKDGNFMWADVSVALRCDSSGAPMHYITTIVDMTERKRAEEALLESEEKFRQLAENVDHVFWLTDWKEKRLAYVNPAYERVFGLSVESAYEDRLSWKAAVHPDDLAGVDDTLKEGAAKGKRVELDYRIMRDGNVRWIHEIAFPVKDRGGSIIRYVNIAEDITERKAHEREIEDLNSFLMSIRNINQEIVRTTDFQTLLKATCRILAEIHGYIDVSIAYLDEETGRIVPKAHAGNHRKTWFFGEYMESDAPPCIMKVLSCRTPLFLVHGKDPCADCPYCQHESPHQSIIVPMFDGEKPVGLIMACLELGSHVHRDEIGLFIEVAGDIVFANKKLKAENELKEMAANLQNMVDVRTQEVIDLHQSMLKQERLAALGQMAASVSHELRNPLSVINSAVYYLKARYADEDDKTIKMLDILEKEVARSDRIIGDMLQFSQHKPNLAENFDINELLYSMLSPPENVPGNVRVEFNLQPDLPRITADPDKLKQIITNLVNNAFHAMPDGGTLTLGTKQTKPDSVTITVTDTGCGMAPDVMEKIFEPLFSTKTTGFGLGLAIVSQLVEDHGGRIYVSSEPGKGTLFTITLPIGVVS